MDTNVKIVVSYFQSGRRQYGECSSNEELFQFLTILIQDRVRFDVSYYEVK